MRPKKRRRRGATVPLLKSRSIEQAIYLGPVLLSLSIVELVYVVIEMSRLEAS
jgi:hypothetical protein